MLTPQTLAIIRVTFIEARDGVRLDGRNARPRRRARRLRRLRGFLRAFDQPSRWHLRANGRPVRYRRIRAPGVQRLDLIGAALSSLRLGLLLYPLIDGREAGWPSWTWAMLGASSIVLGVFVVHQHRKSVAKTSPLLDTELFFDRAFCVGLLLILLFYWTSTSTGRRAGRARKPVRRRLIQQLPNPLVGRLCKRSALPLRGPRRLPSASQPFAPWRDRER